MQTWVCSIIPFTHIYFFSLSCTNHLIARITIEFNILSMKGLQVLVGLTMIGTNVSPLPTCWLKVSIKNLVYHKCKKKTKTMIILETKIALLHLHTHNADLYLISVINHFKEAKGTTNMLLKIYTSYRFLKFFIQKHTKNIITKLTYITTITHHFSFQISYQYSSIFVYIITNSNQYHKFIYDSVY